MQKATKGPRNILNNQRFGKLVALSYIKQNGKYHWICQCDCGEQTVVHTTLLTTGKTKSCGCLRKENYHNKEENRLKALQTHLYRSTIVRRTKALGFESCISFERFTSIIMQPCYYCTAPYSTVLEDHKGRKLSNPQISDTVLYCNGIDRMDNNQGYIDGNVVACCKFCNTAKLDMTMDEFKQWIETVYHYQYKEKEYALQF